MPALPVSSAACSLPVDRRKSRCCQRGKVGWWRWNLRAGPVSDCASTKCIQIMKEKELLRVSVLGNLAVSRHRMKDAAATVKKDAGSARLSGRHFPSAQPRTALRDVLAASG